MTSFHQAITMDLHPLLEISNAVFSVIRRKMFRWYLFPLIYSYFCNKPKVKNISVVRHNITPTRSCVRFMATTEYMKMLQVYPPRTMESMLVARNKYVSLVHISNSPQTNRHDRKDILEQAAECLYDISMDSCSKLW